MGTWGPLTWLSLGSRILLWAELLPATSDRGPGGAYKHPQLGRPAPQGHIPGVRCSQLPAQRSQAALCPAAVRESEGLGDPGLTPPFFLGSLSGFFSLSLSLSHTHTHTFYLSFSFSLILSLIKSLSSSLPSSLSRLCFPSKTSRIQIPSITFYLWNLGPVTAPN